jgi:hypothetical protein
MLPGTTIGRPKKAEKKGLRPRTVGVRASGEWADWVEELAKHCRTDIAKLIDSALAAHAKAVGFGKTPPERVP